MDPERPLTAQRNRLPWRRLTRHESGAFAAQVSLRSNDPSAPGFYRGPSSTSPPNLSRRRAEFSRCRPDAAAFPKLAKFRPSPVGIGHCWPNSLCLVEVGRAWPKSSQVWSASAPILSKMRPKVVNIGRSWAGVTRVLPRSAQVRLVLGKVRSRSAKLGCTWPNLDRRQPKPCQSSSVFGRIRLLIPSRTWPTSFEFGQSWPPSGKTRPEFGQVRGDLGRVLPNVGNTWPALTMSPGQYG